MPTPTSERSSPPARLELGDLDYWAIDPSIAFLNHGSFGARPRAVLAARDDWRARMERNPVEALDRLAPGGIEEAAGRVAAFLGADPAGLGFVTNASEGVTAVLRSLGLRRGDRVVTTTHVYNGVRQTLAYLRDTAGVESVEVDVPIPIADQGVVVDRLAPWLEPPTRLLLVDHVTSPTGLVLPIQSLIGLARARGVATLVDGAHGPGMVEVDLARLRPAFYVGNLHKWVCAPVGAGFLWAEPERRASVHPLVTSHPYGGTMAEEFAWQGTRDLSPWLAAPVAIDWLGAAGWENVRRHNQDLVRWARDLLAGAWSVEPVGPEDGSMLGSLATVPLPGRAATRGTAEALQASLLAEHRIEVPVVEWADRRFIRVSAQLYNRPEHYERLAGAIRAIA